MLVWVFGTLGFQLLAVLLVIAVILRRVLWIVIKTYAYRFGIWKPLHGHKPLRKIEGVKKRVAVIGGGSCGLTAAKCLLDEGHDVVVFEKSDHIGGNWAYTNKEGSYSAIYETTIPFSSKENMCFSDYPIPRHLPVYMGHRDVLSYLESYATKFQLAKHIRFNTCVISVTPSETSKTEEEEGESIDGIDAKSWRIVSETVPPEPEDPSSGASTPCATSPLKDTLKRRYVIDKERARERDRAKDNTGEPMPAETNTPAPHRMEEVFDAVVVCNGHHWSPKMPHFEGETKFEGEIMHSHRYKRANRFAGKRVVVVGVGNSGCDIATECSRVCKDVYLSTRRGCYVIPKFYFGVPVDYVYSNRFFSMLPEFIRNLIFLVLTWIVRGGSGRYGLTQNYKGVKTHPTLNTEILYRILHKSLTIKPHVKEIREHTVVFEDDTEVEADVIIYATGYKIEFPFLDTEKVLGCDCSKENNQVKLYKYVVPRRAKNIFFVGLIQPLGAIFPIAELQSRWVAALLAGLCDLPTPEEMQEDLRKKRDRIRKEYVHSSRHTMQVEFVEYCDEIADLIGVKPKIYKHSDLLWEMLFGVGTPVQYRLDGHGKWADASKSIRLIYKTA